MDYTRVIQYWFQELQPSQWFKAEPGVDLAIRTRFSAIYEAGAREELASWRQTADGRLAEILVLDQFPRNMFRDRPECFATDDLALRLAQEAVAAGADQNLTSAHRAFLYMPYMHSESREIHREAVRLFSQPGLEFNLKYEIAHKEIIDRFGRYPHRNAILGRESTPDEIQFIKTHPGF